MSFDELRSQITRSLSGRSFALRADALNVRAIQLTLRALFSDQTLKIDDAGLTEDPQAGTVTVSGKAAIFAQQRVDMSARFLLHEATPAVVLEVSGFPALWTLGQSFPALKGSALDSYAVRNVRITIDSRGQETSQAQDGAGSEAGTAPSWWLPRDFQTRFGLQPVNQSLYLDVLRGLTLEAEIDLGPLNMLAWMLEGERAVVKGAMELVGGAPRFWARSEPMKAVDVSGFSLPVSVELVSVLDEASSGQGSSPGTTPQVRARAFTRLAAAATYRGNGQSLALPLGALIEDPDFEKLTFEVDPAELSRLAFEGLANALGASGLMAGTQGFFPALEKVSIERLAVTIHSKTRTVLTVLLEVGLDAALTVVPKRFSMRGFRLSFLLVAPGTSVSQLTAWTLFEADCFGRAFSGWMSLPDLSFSASAKPGQPLNVGQLVEELVPELKGPPLDCERLEVWGRVPTGTLGMLAVLDGSWEIPIGTTGLKIEQLTLQWEVSAATTSVQAVLGGVVSLGGVELGVRWELPGGLMLEGRVDSLSLLSTLEHLIGKSAVQALPFPTKLLDVGLEDVSLTADLSRRSFSLGARASGFGRLELFVEKPQDGGWGMGLGVTVDGDFQLSNLDKRLKALDGLGIANAYLLFSSFSPRALTLPGQPGGAGLAQRGINLYLPLTLKAKGALALLAKTVGDGASLMLRGSITDQGGNLEASMAGFTLARGVDFQSAGFRMSFERDGDMSMAVFGRIAVALKDQLLFDGQMIVEPTGMMLTASMVGEWKQAFGVRGFSLANVALTVGVGASGLPTLGLAGAAAMGSFRGAFAVLFNSVDPAESVLSLQFNELTLATFLEAAISPNVVRSLPKELTGLLDSGYRDVDIYLCPESTFIGANYYQQGFRFRAKLKLLGWDARVDATADWQTGLRFDGSMEPLRLGKVGRLNRYALEITAADDASLFAPYEARSKGTPNPFTSTKAPAKAVPKKKAAVMKSTELGGPRLRAALNTFEPPSFLLSSRVALLSFFEEQVLIEASTSGMRFALARTSGATSSRLACTVGAQGFNAEGALAFAIKLDLKLKVPKTRVSLGRVKLNSRLEGQLRLLITAKEFRAEVEGGFTWQKYTLRLPKVVATAPMQDLQQLIAQALKALESGASDIFQEALKGFEDFAGALEQGWVKAEDGAEVLGRAISEAYRADARQAARAFKAAGHTADAAATVLRKQWRATEKDVNKLLKDAGFNPKQIERAVGQAFQDLAKATTQTGKNVVKATTQAGKDVGKATTQAGKDVGKAATQAEKSVEKAGKDAVKKAKKWLKL